MRILKTSAEDHIIELDCKMFLYFKMEKLNTTNLNFKAPLQISN